MSLLLLAGAALAYGGLAANSFTMDRHYADIHGRGAAPDARLRRRYRIIGWGGILLSLLACIQAAGWHLGPVLWCGVLTASALGLTLLLVYAPRPALLAARILYPAALLAGGAALLLH